MTSPKLSFIIPTLNSGKILDTCLHSIKKQTFTDYEIIIADGGSCDNTLEIVQKYHCRLVSNPLKTAEAGKAIGLREAHGTFVALIDSDNILPTKYWLKKMLLPFSDLDIIGSEPLKFTYRKNAGYIERYSALIGANDPYAYVTGSYDRYSYLSQKWTNINLDIKDKQSYLKIKITNSSSLPTIGANGTIFRKNFLLSFFKSNYLFDIDLLALAPKPLYFAKVKIGIIHTFCESSLSKFLRKQQRRLTDYYIYRGERQFHWPNSAFPLKYILYSVLLLPAIFDSIKGYFRLPDPAWFFHPLACFLSLWIYFIVTLKFRLHLLKPVNRLKWQQ